MFTLVDGVWKDLLKLLEDCLSFYVLLNRSPPIGRPGYTGWHCGQDKGSYVNMQSGVKTEKYDDFSLVFT